MSVGKIAGDQTANRGAQPGSPRLAVQFTLGSACGAIWAVQPSPPGSTGSVRTFAGGAYPGPPASGRAAKPP